MFTESTKQSMLITAKKAQIQIQDKMIKESLKLHKIVSPFCGAPVRPNKCDDMTVSSYAVLRRPDRFVVSVQFDVSLGVPGVVVGHRARCSPMSRVFRRSCVIDNSTCK